jgi:hypothetical protein
MVHQTVTVKEGDKSKRMTKGEALIKVIMNKSSGNGKGQGSILMRNNDAFDLWWAWAGGRRR